MYNRWKKIKDKIINRDGNKCTKCGKTEKLCVHHIDMSGDQLHQSTANNKEDNLITLCPSCHTSLHWKETKNKGFMNIFEYKDSFI